VFARDNWPRLIVLAVIVLLVAGACAPGNARWSVDNRASFWAGLWHGLIIVITFVVSLFTNQVSIYETNNTGWPYNLGFLLGAMMALGGGVRSATHRRRRRQAEWDKVGDQIAASVRARVGSELRTEEKDWDEFERRVEESIRAEFRKSWKE
jgi:hypothetical protein